MGLAPTLAAAPAAHATAGFTFTRIAGANRFATAAAVAAQAFPQGSKTVIIATGFNFPDALAGNYLAGLQKSPILLVNVDSIPSETSAALKSLGATNVIILGQTAAVSQNVQNQLQSSGYAVSRIGGGTRYDTMQMIDEAPNATTIGVVNGKKTALLARGDNFPDALGGGPVAYAKNFPVILTSPSTLSPQAADVIQKDGIQQVIILGGTVAIPAAVEQQVNALGAATLYRADGIDRSDTSRKLGEYAIANLGFSNAQFTVASGDQYFTGADALTSGPFSGNKNIPNLITNSVNDAGHVVNFYQENYNTETSGYAIGGTVPLPDSTLAQITGATPPSNQAYTFSPAYGTSQNVPTGNTVSYTVSGLGTSPVNIAIFKCSQVTNNNGTATFPNSSNPGSASGNAAQAPTSSAQITVVNGAPTNTTTNQVNGVTPNNGTVSFSYTDATSECTIPVVYQQTASSPSTLFLGSNNSPSSPYGAGGQTNFIPPAASTGTINSTPGVTAATTTYFAQGGFSYQYKSGDQYQLVTGVSATNPNGTCTSTTYQDFQNRLTNGDTVSGYYNPSGVSTFCLNDIAPPPPATVAATSTGNTTGTTVTFTQPTSVESTSNIVSYTVYRAAATAPTVTGAPYTCPALPGSPGVSPQAPPAAPYTAVATIPAQPTTSTAGYTYTAAGGTGTYTYNDTAATAGSTTPANQYCYAVASNSPNAAGGTQTGTGRGAGPVAGSNGPSAAGAPVFTAATASPVTATAAGTTGTVTVYYNQPIDCSTVDGSSSSATPSPVTAYDYAVSTTSSGVTTARTITNVVCTSSGSGLNGASNVGSVVITYSTGSTPVPAGSTVLVTAKQGFDGNTVGNTTTPKLYQPVGDAVQANV